MPDLFEMTPDELRKAATEGKYNPKVKQPTKGTRPKLAREHTAAEAQSYAVALGTYEKGSAGYETELAAFNEDRAKVNAAFRTDLETAFGTGKSAKAEALFALALKNGEASGPVAVIEQYEAASALLS